MNHTSHIRRCVITTVLMAGLVASLAAPAAAAPAPTDPIGTRQAQANQLLDRIEANGRRISALAEQYNGAQLELQAAAATLEQLKGKIETTQRQVDELRAFVRTRAAVIYRQSVSGSMTNQFDTGDAGELVRSQKYADAQSRQDNVFLTQLEDAKRLLGKQRAEAEAAKNEAERKRREIAEAIAGLESANAQQQQLLAQTTGELAQLFAQEQQRREAAALAAAQARFSGSAPTAPTANPGSPNAPIPNAPTPSSPAPTMPAPTTPAANPGSPNAPTPSSPAPTTPAPTTPATAPPTTTPPTTQPAAAPAPAPAPVPGAASIAIAFAYAQLGKPYEYAAAGPNSYDCSGLTMRAYQAAGISMAHYSGAQFDRFPKVSLASMLPGDLVFWGPGGSEHVGIYIGGGQMIHSPHTGDVVRIAPVYGSPSGAVRPW
jgi:cell wall-associated NlpC family hydrolase